LEELLVSVKGLCGREMFDWLGTNKQKGMREIKERNCLEFAQKCVCRFLHGILFFIDLGDEFCVRMGGQGFIRVNIIQKTQH
jgi:hypothetical protein